MTSRSREQLALFANQRYAEFCNVAKVVREAVTSLDLSSDPSERAKIAAGYTKLFDALFPSSEDRKTVITLSGDRLEEAKTILSDAFLRCTNPDLLEYTNGIHPQWYINTITPRGVLCFIKVFNLDGQGEKNYRQIAQELGLNRLSGGSVSDQIKKDIPLLAQLTGAKLMDAGIISYHHSA